jgi:AcrR family transcriptional regulator
MESKSTAKQPKTTKSTEPRPQAERRDEAERRLLAAAADIVAERGVDGLTLAEVGAAAGYSRGLPAHYYGNKNGLLEAVANYISDGFASRLEQSSESKSALAALLGAVGSYLSVVPRTRKRAVTVQAIIAESLTESALRPAVTGINERSVKRLAGMIRTGMERGEIRRDIDPERQASILLGALRTLMAMWLIDPQAAALEPLRDAFVACVRRTLAS